MSFLTFKRKISAGLAIDGSFYHYLSLERKDGKYKAVNSAVGNIPECLMPSGAPFQNSGAYLNDIFGHIVSAIPSLHHEVSFALPAADSLLRVFAMPGLTLSEARQAFKYDFENHFPFPEADGVYDIAEIDYPADGGFSEKRFIAAAARRTLVENITRAASAHNIKILSIEPSPTALERAIGPAASAEDSNILVYAGRSSSVLILSWHGNGIFYRNLSLGFPPEITEKGLDSKEYEDNAYAFAHDLRSSLQFGLSLNRGFVPDSLYVFGPGADAKLCMMLKDSFSVETAAAIDTIDAYGIDLKNDGQWDTALGLALRQ